MDGRVLTEALDAGEEPSVEHETMELEGTDRVYLEVSWVEQTRYVDCARKARI